MISDIDLINNNMHDIEVYNSKCEWCQSQLLWSSSLWSVKYNYNESLNDMFQE